jgi:crotonobetainyl-CoA:carnitine CoA-transferase CaiB-like acyl-CoA transferase
LQDPRFNSLQKRAENGDAINEIVAEWCREHTAEEIERIMIAADVPVTRAFSIAEIAEDPHYAARENIVTVDDPTIGPLRMQGVYPRLSATPGRIERGAPKLGAHNEEVYGKLLGLTAPEIAELRAKGVI